MTHHDEDKVNACVLEALQRADPPKSGSEPPREDQAALSTSTGDSLNYVRVKNAVTPREILEVEVLQECVARHVEYNVEDRLFYRDTNCALDTLVNPAPDTCQEVGDGDKYAGGNRVVYMNGNIPLLQVPFHE